MCLVLKSLQVLVGALVGLFEPVRKCWTFVLISVVCLSQSGRAGLLWCWWVQRQPESVRKSWTIVLCEGLLGLERRQCQEGSVLGGCGIYIVCVSGE